MQGKKYISLIANDWLMEVSRALPYSPKLKEPSLVKCTAYLPSVYHSHILYQTNELKTSTFIIILYLV